MFFYEKKIVQNNAENQSGAGYKNIKTGFKNRGKMKMNQRMRIL